MSSLFSLRKILFCDFFLNFQTLIFNLKKYKKIIKSCKKKLIKRKYLNENQKNEIKTEILKVQSTYSVIKFN